MLKSLMAVGTKDLLILSVLRDELLTAAAPLSCHDAVEMRFIVLQKTEYNFLLIRCYTTALRGCSLLEEPKEPKQYPAEPQYCISVFQKQITPS